MRRYGTAAVVYTALALAGGVFYREFTKFQGFTGETALSVVHTHYFLLGMMVFLLLALLERSFSFTTRAVRRGLIVYHIGLNLTAGMLVVPGGAPGAGYGVVFRAGRVRFRRGWDRSSAAGREFAAGAAPAPPPDVGIKSHIGKETRRSRVSFAMVKTIKLIFQAKGCPFSRISGSSSSSSP